MIEKMKEYKMEKDCLSNKQFWKTGQIHVK